MNPTVEDRRGSKVSLVARGHRLWGPSSYALTANGLDLGDGRVVPYVDIVGTSTRLTTQPELRHAQITVHTRRGRHVIPGRLSIPSHNFYDELMRQVTRAHEKLHKLGDAGPGRAPYHDMPPAVQEIVEREADPEAARAAPGFRGRVQKSAAPLHPVHLAALACAVTALLISGLPMPHLVIGLALTLAAPALVLLAQQLTWRGSDEWLCLHPRGLAMIGKNRTGELAWDDVAATTMRGRGLAQGAAQAGASTLVIRTLGGADFPVADRYDTPIGTIERLASRHLAAAQHQ